MMASVTLDNGMTIRTFPPPPAGAAFDPLTASAADLALHGFPARPEDPELLARYRRHFNRLGGRFQYIVPTFSVGPSSRSDAKGETLLAGGAAWTGVAVYAPSGKSFKWVQGEWIVPNVSAPVPGNSYNSPIWVGLGNGSLCQAGVWCGVDQNGKTSFNLWYEWFPTGAIFLTNVSVSPGDLIAVVICTQSGAGSTSATVAFSNNTSGHSTSFMVSPPSNAPFTGDQAEWIVEQPQNDATKLPDFGQVFFTSATAGLESGGIVNAGTTGVNSGRTNGGFNWVVSGSAIATGAVIAPTIVQCQYVGTEPNDNASGLINT